MESRLIDIENQIKTCEDFYLPILIEEILNQENRESNIETIIKRNYGYIIRKATI